MSEDFKIFLEDLLVFLECQEAGVVQLRRQISKLLGEAKPGVKLPFDASKIKWQDRENAKGKFQFSEDFDSVDHKALLKFLSEYTPSKCVTSEGWFYWVYREGSKIGRKLRAK